jgi:hypothetical protein
MSQIVDDIVYHMFCFTWRNGAKTIGSGWTYTHAFRQLGFKEDELGFVHSIKNLGPIEHRFCCMYSPGWIPRTIYESWVVGGPSHVTLKVQTFMEYIAGKPTWIERRVTQEKDSASC